MAPPIRRELVMERSMLSWVCVFALVAVPLVGCNDNDGPNNDPGPDDIRGDGGSGGSAGNGGAGGSAPVFTYSLLTSASGDAGDLLDGLRSSTLPALEDAGAQVFALLGEYLVSSDEQNEDPFDEITESQVAVLLRWKSVDEDALAAELGRLSGVSAIDTSSYVPGHLFDEEENTAGQGFYLQRWSTCLPEDVDEVLSLNAEIADIFVPLAGVHLFGTLVDLEEKDGLARILRIVRYDSADHWWMTRIVDDPRLGPLVVEQNALFVGPTIPWSGRLLER